MHELALHRAPIFLSKSAAWLAFLSSQDYTQGGLYVKANKALMKQHFKLLWFKFWAAVGSWLCPGFVVHSYLSHFQIEILLTGVHILFIPFEDRRNLKEIYVHLVGQRQWEVEETQNFVSAMASPKSQGTNATVR